MFDAKSILDSLVRGAAPQTSGAQGGQGGGLADILGQILGGGQGSGQGGAAGGGLGDILSEIGKMTNPGGQTRGGQATGGRAPGSQAGDSHASDSEGGGGLADIFSELQKQLGQAGSSSSSPSQSRGAVESPGASQGDGGFGDILGQPKDALGNAGGASAGGGSIIDVLGKVLGQAASGTKEGATRIGEATGANDALDKITGGKSAGDLLDQLRQIVRDNPLASAGAAGGLGGLVLGTRAGRAVAGQAARLGALALIGGLAYKAYQNYQAGKPLITGLEATAAAPQGSGFEPGAITNDSAALYIRAMIAAAAADGRVDDAEQQKIIGGLKQAGVDAEAEEFLANELNNPATAEQLAQAVTSPEEAVQVYTAARLAIEPDSQGEAAFLARLASLLGIDPQLAAHIDATTRAAG